MIDEEIAELQERRKELRQIIADLRDDLIYQQGELHAVENRLSQVYIADKDRLTRWNTNVTSWKVKAADA